MNEESQTPLDPTADDALAAAAEATAPADVTAPVESPARPEGVPEKFWDPEAGQLRTDALLKSYLELERRLGADAQAASDPAVAGDAAIAAPEDAAPVEDGLAPNIPADPQGYEITTESDLVAPDPEVNRRLHAAGFTQDQAQLVYKLAEDYLLPAVSEAYGEVFVQQELGKLEQAFGGPEGWQATAEQLRTWGKANLDADVYETLAASSDGVLAMHQMMQAREPRVVHADAPTAPADEGQLRRMMQDPRYWRDRDPAFVKEVTRGFERLFKD
ncbi:MAG: capsid assembly protein [Alphaproteobacteria bacterium]